MQKNRSSPLDLHNLYSKLRYNRNRLKTIDFKLYTLNYNIYIIQSDVANRVAYLLQHNIKHYSGDLKSLFR